MDIETEFDKVKGNLFFKKGAGFLGGLLFSTNFIWTTSVSTAATNGLVLKWNPDFFMSLDRETRITVLAHELWHIALFHVIRRGNRDPKLWNIACDHVVNILLHDHGYNMKGFPYVMDFKFRGWATEDIYKYLEKEGGGSKQPTVGNFDMSGDIEEPDMTSEGNTTIADIVSKVVTAVTTAKMTKSAGDIPGEVTYIVDQFLYPQLPWNILIHNFMNELSEIEYSSKRPNKRYDDPTLPGRVKNTGLEHLGAYLDISGSIQDKEILRFNSEMKYVFDTYNPETMTLNTFDTIIHDRYRFEKDQRFDKITVTGRGGTSLDCVMEDIKKSNHVASIIFTDMHVPSIPSNPGTPVIWICMDNPKAEVPYGKLIHYNESSGFKFGN